MDEQEIEKRNKMIKWWYFKEHKTLEYIGKKYNLTPERVRQIVGDHYEQAVRDKKRHYQRVKKDYSQIKNVIDDKTLLSEIERLSKPSRRQELVLQRQILIKVLRDKYKFSFPQIGFLLQRDHSSVIYLYYKK